MNKSIYEKALDVIENIDRNLPSTWLMGRDNLMKIKQTLEQAQKQEQLLKLYKELITVKNKMIYLVFFDNDLDDISKIVIDLEQQIKELENNE